MTPGPVTALWLLAALGLVVVLGCFIVRACPTALRLHSLGWGALVFVTGRAGLLAAGFPLRAESDFPLLVALPLAAGLLLPRQVWLVRAAASELRERVRQGCAGLLVEVCRERQGVLEITVRGHTHCIHFLPLGARLCMLELPATGRKGKVALLGNWLSSQYPGPLPRPRIHLKRRSR